MNRNNFAPGCEHDCTSDCRHDGCNCLCGEWHGSYEKEEQDELATALANLAKVNKEVAEAGKTALPKIFSFNRTAKLIAEAVGAHDYFSRPSRSALNVLKRPPAILSAALFKKHES
jgi:hypothetical protein